MSGKTPDIEIAPGVHLPCVGFGVGTRAGYACSGPECFGSGGRFGDWTSGDREDTLLIGSNSTNIQDLVNTATADLADDATASAVFRALLLGVRHIDEAECYQNEIGTGRAIRSWLRLDPKRNRREDLFVTSKVWRSSCAGELEISGTIKRSCQQSLRRLGLDYFDLYLVHTPGFLQWQPNGKGKRGANGGADLSPEIECARLRQVWRAMEGLVLDSSPLLARAVGVSNFEITHLQSLLRDPSLRLRPCANQLEVHPHFQRPDLLRFCASAGITVTSYGGLKPLTDWQLWGEHWNNCVDGCAGEWYRTRLMNDVVPRIAASKRKTEAQVLQRWNYQFLSVRSESDAPDAAVRKAVITTSRYAERVRESLAVFDGTWLLTEEEMHDISEAGMEHEFRGFW